LLLNKHQFDVLTIKAKIYVIYTMNKLIRIHPDDNVAVVRESIIPGDKEEINGQTVLFNSNIGLGHKIAAKNIEKGELIIKYGVPIGSAIVAIETGTHIHLHNMKSDYIPTFVLDNQFENGK